MLSPYEQELLQRYFHYAPKPDETLDMASSAMDAVVSMYDFYEIAGDPLPINEKCMDTLREAHEILIDLYHMMKGDTE